ncbi:hypothetical protein B0H15DRAFT_934226 [Mycena belliarum]|uniref:Uncharacterized protein n=1 Tax=Mycena belliarum TaxID=1033014 RepID=A0AAD6TU62_9AGAR|nr:hypothetical protein B0H15DRAFT_934226 [Mycena belliae]
MPAPSSFPMPSDSDSSTTHARPPRAAPPLTSMPSTPGPQVPGGYPRNSVVFADNKWDHRGGTDSDVGLLTAAKAYLPDVEKAKGLLPPTVASYFPQTTGAPSGSASTHRIAAANSNLAVHTPYPLATDGSVVSNFSTHAYAGSGSSRSSTPVPSEAHADAECGENPEGERPPSEASTAAPIPPSPPAEERRRTQLIDHGVVPVPSSTSRPTLSPPAADSNSSGSGSGSGSTATPSTAPSSPAPPHSPGSPKTPSAFVRWASRRTSSKTSHVRSASASTPAASPPSAFSARASLDSAPTSSASAPPSAFAKPASGADSPASSPSRKASLLRALRPGRVRDSSPTSSQPPVSASPTSAPTPTKSAPSAPPSSFTAPNAASSPTKYEFTPLQDTPAPPSRRASLLRTLRALREGAFHRGT